MVQVLAQTIHSIQMALQNRRRRRIALYITSASLTLMGTVTGAITLNPIV